VEQRFETKEGSGTVQYLEKAILSCYSGYLLDSTSEQGITSTLLLGMDDALLFWKLSRLMTSDRFSASVALQCQS